MICFLSIIAFRGSIQCSLNSLLEKKKISDPRYPFTLMLKFELLMNLHDERESRRRLRFEAVTNQWKTDNFPLEGMRGSGG